MLILEKYTIGVGDRFAHQAKAQLQACVQLANDGINVVPVWNKSNREHSFIGSEPQSVYDAAKVAVEELAWHKGWHVDADHINMDTVDKYLACSDFFTIDVADFIGQSAEGDAVPAFVERHPELIGSVSIEGIDQPFDISREYVGEVAGKYLFAVQAAAKIYRHIESSKGEFIAEVSMDETDAPQTPPELLIILAALADEGVKLQTVAPKFTGRFNKGVDYVGDLAQFEKEFNDDLAVIAHAVTKYGLPENLKLSVHSGSDKFSIYPIIGAALRRTGAGVHLKTAGTTWLEELIGLAEAGGEGLALAKEIYAKALENVDALCGPYASVIDIDADRLPSAETVNGWSGDQYANALRHVQDHREFNQHFRQLLHIAFKLAAKEGTRYTDLLKANAEVVGRNVTENLYDRHFRRIFLGAYCPVLCQSGAVDIESTAIHSLVTTRPSRLELFFMSHNTFNSLQSFDLGNGKEGKFYSLPALAEAGLGDVSRLPACIRLVLESVLRNFDGQKVTEENIRQLAAWQPNAQRTEEIPFTVARIVLQDFTGVPLLVDLAAMRSAMQRLGKDPKIIEPLVPVDLVVDHSVQVDFAGSEDAMDKNLELEFKRNRERYQFLKWGMQAFDTFKVVPPGIGIVHQVNLEYLARGVLANADGIYYPDTLVGTDSHTTMINGLGIVGWGVGGIEAEAGMLGQPVYFLTPDVVGVQMEGSLREGVTATDLALTVTEMLREAKVVGKFVEFYGQGAKDLPLTDRATIANMAPEYGATMGFFPIDDETVNYLRATGRSEEHCTTYANYYKAQGLFGIPSEGDVDYSVSLKLDLATIQPSVAGPRRPQDRIEVPSLGAKFEELFSTPVADGGFGRDAGNLTSVKADVPTEDGSAPLGHGDVVIAAITSCTNTSNPSVMLAAGLLAKKAVEKGLKVSPLVKASLGPGSRVVSDYLEKTGLQPYLDQLGFNLVGYGCTTCIGNSGPLDAEVEKAILENNLVAASVLSGNRNFEARVHQNVRGNFLMSPPLVVAFALVGRVNIDLTNEPLGQAEDGSDVFLRDLWPSLREVRDLMQSSLKPEVFRELYSNFTDQNPKWNEIPSSVGHAYEWDEASTYIQEPPFFEDFGMEAGAITEITGARPLGVFGDSVTTDHISPAGAIKQDSPAGRYLVDNSVDFKDFNSYGSRRGNDRVMTRGTFANVRIKNLMVPGTEGGVTRHQPSGEQMDIYDAAIRYREEGTPLVVVGGKEYGTGSSRDWAAKGTRLLGVRAVVCESFERIHRSNLIGMGVLPLQFKEGDGVESLGLDGSETYGVIGLNDDLKAQQELTLRITRADGSTSELVVLCRVDTDIEVEYYRHGGILTYVLRQLAA